MSAKSWRYARASVVGTSHRQHGQPCQDYSECSVLLPANRGSVLVAVACDGAGSAARAEVGAALTGSLFLAEVAALYERGDRDADPSREFVDAWLGHLHEEIRTRAAAEGLTARDFASTLVAAIVEESRAAFVQVGDGAIVTADARARDVYTHVFWPQRGEFANTTYFVTDADAASHVDFRLVEGRIDEVALLTDGLQSLALDYRARAAHAPFFGPMLAPVRVATPGYSSKLSEALASFLASGRVNARTDDDKTLLLASRRPRDRRRASPAPTAPHPATDESRR